MSVRAVAPLKTALWIPIDGRIWLTACPVPRARSSRSQRYGGLHRNLWRSGTSAGRRSSTSAPPHAAAVRRRRWLANAGSILIAHGHEVFPPSAANLPRQPRSSGVAQTASVVSHRITDGTEGGAQRGVALVGGPDRRCHRWSADTSDRARAHPACNTRGCGRSLLAGTYRVGDGFQELGKQKRLAKKPRDAGNSVPGGIAICRRAALMKITGTDDN